MEGNKKIRYQYLFELVNEVRPKHVVEIGTWNGKRAAEFMAVSNCYYTGFDLFEAATKETDEEELNIKPNCDMMEVAKTIESVGLSRFCLIRGNTKETLWKAKLEPFDFCFIDGGHSVLTIQNDYEWAITHIEPGGIIVIDDYYTPEKVGFGCNFLEDKGTLFEGSDKIRSGGHVSMLRIDA